MAPNASHGAYYILWPSHAQIHPLNLSRRKSCKIPVVKQQVVLPGYKLVIWLLIFLAVNDLICIWTLIQQEQLPPNPSLWAGFRRSHPLCVWSLPFWHIVALLHKHKCPEQWCSYIIWGPIIFWYPYMTKLSGLFHVYLTRVVMGPL